uniref:Srf-type transcription factor n=1 Tax=Melanopsichium pennsylvanicum 4 TaxID=1398559 RepID=A0A077RA66_9BASI|nr:srf-type transcription factor [Melanopsichium pennsylvanicum 4]
MGRKKIKIQPIKEDRNRSVTYLKRKAGLFKKAHELAVLTDSQVAVIVFGHNGKLADGSNAGGPGGGSSGSNGRNGGKVSGIKRKAEPLSPPRSNQMNISNGLAGAQNIGSFGSANGSMGVSPTAKQAVHAALRQKSQNRIGGNLSLAGQMGSQGVFDPFSFGQGFMPGASMPHGMAGGPVSSMSAVGPPPAMAGQGATSGPSTNPTRAETIASMSISMPSNDRVPIFVSPATPGFGLTPGGTITTPGGRRFSFSDVLTRGSSGAMLQRPVTANSHLGNSFFHNQDFGMSASPQAPFNGVPPSHSPQPPQDASLHAATAAAAFAYKGAIERGSDYEASPTPVPHSRFNAHPMSRPASTGLQRSGAPTYGEATYTPVSGSAVIPGNNPASAAHIVRPFTANGNLEAPSSSDHLIPPTAAFSGSLNAQGLHANSASPVPHQPALHVNARGALPIAYNAGRFVGADLKSSATPLGSQASSATPELVQHRSNAASGPGLGVSASRSSISTDEETPPGNNTTFIADNGKLDPNSAWLSIGQSIDQKSGNLVQPVPINPTQSLGGSVPFDLSCFPTQPAQ